MNEDIEPGITLEEWLYRRAEREVLGPLGTISKLTHHDLLMAGMDPVEVEKQIKESLNG